jgi:hypothetical protein
MMELLVSHGADVNAFWHGSFPIILLRASHWIRTRSSGCSITALTRTVATTGMRWATIRIQAQLSTTSCARTRALPKRLSACVDVLLEAGGVTKYDVPGMMDLLRGRIDGLAGQLRGDRELVNTRFSELDCGASGGATSRSGRNAAPCRGGIPNLAAAALLLDEGADVNARATVDQDGVGGQTAIFHAVTQPEDGGLPVAELLIERGADLAVRVKLPGDYERPGEIVECTRWDMRCDSAARLREERWTLLRNEAALNDPQAGCDARSVR